MSAPTEVIWDAAIKPGTPQCAQSIEGGPYRYYYCGPNKIDEKRHPWLNVTPLNGQLPVAVTGDATKLSAGQVFQSWLNTEDLITRPPLTKDYAPLMGIVVNVTDIAPALSTPKITLFSAFPQSIVAGQHSTLKWDVSNATSVIIQPGVGAVALSGTRDVFPTAPTTYALVASNGGDTPITNTATVTVTYPPSNIKTFSLSPTSIGLGQPIKLFWNVENATSVNIIPDIGTVGL